MKRFLHSLIEGFVVAFMVSCAAIAFITAVAIALAPYIVIGLGLYWWLK